MTKMTVFRTFSVSHFSSIISSSTTLPCFFFVTLRNMRKELIELGKLHTSILPQHGYKRWRTSQLPRSTLKPPDCLPLLAELIIWCSPGQWPAMVGCQPAPWSFNKPSLPPPFHFGLSTLQTTSLSFWPQFTSINIGCYRPTIKTRRNLPLVQIHNLGWKLWQHDRGGHPCHDCHKTASPSIRTRIMFVGNKENITYVSDLTNSETSINFCQTWRPHILLHMTWHQTRIFAQFRKLTLSERISVRILKFKNLKNKQKKLINELRNVWVRFKWRNKLTHNSRIPNYP